MARSAGGWIQEMERLGYLNRFRPLIRAPTESVWPYALAQVATLPDVIFEVLRSKPSLVLAEDTEGEEAATYRSASDSRGGSNSLHWWLGGT
jgi:hypothetical protein